MLGIHSVLRGARHSASALALAFSATSPLTAQQMIGPVTIETGGLPIQVRPTLNMERLGNGSVRVTLSSFNAIPDRNTGILVNGRRYNALSFNTALAPYFNAIRVTAISAAIEFSGVQGCSRASDAEWSDGESYTVTSCGNAPGEPKMERYIITRLSTQGLSELQRRVRELIAEEQAKAQQATAAAAAASTAAAGTAGSAASSATSGAAKTGSASGTASGAASTTSGSAGSASSSAPASAPAPQPTAEDYRRSVAAQEAAIDAAGSQVAAAATGMLGAMAENRRIDEARRQREALAAEARADALRQYINRMRVQYNNAPSAPRCRASDRRAMSFGDGTSGSLTLSNCRDEEGRAMHEYVLNVPVRTLMEFTLNATGFYGDAVLETPDGRMITPGQKAIVESGSYRVIVRTRYPGETGTYVVRAATTLRSQYNRTRFVITPSINASTTTINEFDTESGIALGFSAYARVWKGLMLGGTGTGTFFTTASTYHTELDFGARYYLGSDFWSWRPFVGAGFGRTKYTNDNFDDFIGSGPVAHFGLVQSLASLGHGAGMEYSIQYSSPVTLENNGAPLDFSNVRFRVGLTASFPKVWY